MDKRLIVITAVKTLAWLCLFCGILLYVFWIPSESNVKTPMEWRMKRFGAHCEFLESADSVELISLWPDAPSGNVEELGRVRFTAEQVSEVANGLWYSVNSGSSEISVMCYMPRHRLVARRDGAVRSFEICFQCSTLRIWEGGGRNQEEIHLERSQPQAMLNAILDDAGIVRDSVENPIAFKSQ